MEVTAIFFWYYLFLFSLCFILLAVGIIISMVTSTKHYCKEFVDNENEWITSEEELADNLETVMLV